MTGILYVDQILSNTSSTVLLTQTNATTITLGATGQTVNFATGGTLSLPSSSVSLSNLTATGTPSSTTFLRGDNTWNSPLAGNGPTFSAYQSVSVSINNGVSTKITFTNLSFDTNNNYNTSTSRFTPTVAGYYQINATVNINFSSSNFGVLILYKNGSNIAFGPIVTGTGFGCQTALSALIYMNGSTDYLEVYVYQYSGSTQSTFVSTVQDYFQGFLARTA
jgi:hypothetical protein